MLKKFLVFATVVAVAFGLTQVPLSGTYTGQLTISDYETYYIEYPENTSYVGISLAATELTGGDCDYLYFYGPNTFGIPCGSYPDNDIPNVNNDPCDPTDYTSVSTGSSTSTRYYAVGRYVNTVLGYTVYPAGGKLFFTVNKYDEDDTGCGFTITTTTSACPNADRANNGIAIGTGGSTYTSSVPELDCAVYTNISLTSSDVADQQKINNATGYVVYKAIIAKNTAYVNVTLTGTSDVSSSFVVTGAYYAATTSTDSDLSCSKTIYFDSTSLNGTTTFTCFNVPQGPFYITLDIGSDQYFNGTLTTTAHICADGTATFGFDSDDNNLNCSAAYYFNATSLVSGTPINFTNVATGFYQQGYFDFPAQLVGGSITLNYTGCASATSCTAFFGVSLTMNPGINDNYFYTSSSFNGFSLNSFDTNANGTFNTISGGQRFYVSYYCSTGPCSSSIFLSGFVPPPPAVTTTSGTTGNSTTTARATSTAGVTGTTSNSTSTTTATSTARLTSTGNSTTSSNTTTTARATSTGGNASSSAVVIPSLAIAFVALVAALF